MADHQGVTLPPHFEPAPYVPASEVPDTQAVQAQAEGVEGVDFLTFFDQKFRLAEKVGVMPMIAFANASKKGLDSDDMEGLAAMYSLIRSVIHRPPLFDDQGQRQVDENGRPLRDETEWNRFVALADDEMADGEEIMGFVQQALGVMSARPRRRREISSDSSPQTSEKLRDASSWPATIPQAGDGLVRVADLGRST